MNNKLIHGLIVGIAFTLVALISIQLFWVRKAIDLKKDEFSPLVYNALERVVEKLAKEETIRRIKTHKQGRFLFTSDAYPQSLEESINDTSYQYLIYKELEKKDEGIEIRLVEEQDGKRTVTDIITRGQHEAPFTDGADPLNYGSVGANDGSTYTGAHLDMHLDSAVKNRLVNQTVLVSDIVRSLVEVDLSEKIEDRIDAMQLRDLIQNELRQEGIEADFAFGVYDKEGNYRLGSFTNAEEVNKGIYEVTLFPEDLIRHDSSLKVFFPHRISYIVGSISWLLLSSIVLVILISAAFFYSVKMILRQKKLSEIKNDFINNMTHELKTPISTISLACEALGDKDIQTTPALLTRYIGIIGEENKRLGVQVENVLKSAIWGSKAFKMNKERIDMQQIIDSAISKFQMQLREKSGNIQVQHDAKSSILEGDQIHVANAVYNLIDNAIKYSKEDPQILIRTYNEKDNFLFSVQDNGIGISKENQKKIFDKLYRVPTGNQHDVKGFGLGLNYVKTVVERHDGSIKVTSRLNKGSTFTVTLPMNNIVNN
ncbi:HAMP domain-containing histidine kinase [bacterium SCSIO 12741]|nr:HAMP domain-containing histidine kinase [bacterium SCSIO 12741]